MKLLEIFDGLIGGWRDVFSQERTFERARRLTFGLITCLRVHLTSTAICASGRQFQDWTADYRVCSRSPWDPHALFNPVLDALPDLLGSAAMPVLAALDDTMVKKTGRRIPGVSLGRDPLSPPFHVNLQYGLRFVQASVLVAPPEGGAARALPVRFEPAPPAVKPKPPRQPKSSGSEADYEMAMAAYQAAMTAYKEEKKRRRLPQVGLNVIHDLRQSLDVRPGLRDRKLHITGDASYTTRLVLRGLPHDTVYIGRIRKDARLHWPRPVDAQPNKQTKPNGRPRRYGSLAPTPDQIRVDDAIAWQTVLCFVAGEFREMEVKVIKGIYWRKAGPDLLLQLVVIRAPAYRRRQGGRLLYRHPAFLIATDPELALQTLLQSFVYRWEIECNHRDEKSLLGVATGQVRNPEAVRRLPQFQVAAYSLLLLASLNASGFTRSAGQYLPLPKWRRLPESARPSLLDLLNLLRQQCFARGLDHPLNGFDDFSKSEPIFLKPLKPPLSSEVLSTLAA